MNKQPIIAIRDICKSYGSLQVLKNIDLDIYNAEIISLVGASGAGKSTLLHILGTIDRPDKGIVIYDGMNVMELSDKKLSGFRNKNIGFVFQFHHLLSEFTAIENVCIPAYIAGKNKKEAEKRAKNLLDILNLGDRINHKPAELSGGEQQRVAVARSLINNPKIVLADEPSGNLDSENAKELHQLFFTLRDELSITCVIVTHNNDFAAMADRQLKMMDGRIV